MRRQNYRRFLDLTASTIVCLLGLATLAAISSIAASPAMAEEPVATLRGAEITALEKTSAIPRVSNKDLRRMRNFPEQPPTIPHKIRGYQITKNSNKCLSCHSRRGTEQSQAPMVSVTHFSDREGQILTSVSPRRFFCTQCHVTQAEIKALVGNIFLDVGSVLSTLSGKQGN